MDEMYNTQMIRDFLEHLMWEVRIKKYENVNRKDPLTMEQVNPELVEQLKRFTDARHCILIPIENMDPGETSKEEQAELFQVFRKERLKLCEFWLEHLEGLAGLFKMALECAEHDVRQGTVPTNIVRADGFFGDEDGD